jgi:hypothetical protein
LPWAGADPSYYCIRWGEVQLPPPPQIILWVFSFKDIGNICVQRSLQPSLAIDLQLGLWDKVEQGDFFVLASAYNLVTWSI